MDKNPQFSLRKITSIVYNNSGVTIHLRDQLCVSRRSRHTTASCWKVTKLGESELISSLETSFPKKGRCPTIIKSSSLARSSFSTYSIGSSGASPSFIMTLSSTDKISPKISAVCRALVFPLCQISCTFNLALLRNSPTFLTSRRPLLLKGR